MNPKLNCWACTAKSYSDLAKMNRDHVKDCPCFFCVCPYCESDGKVDPRIWVTKNGEKIPISELKTNELRKIKKTMEYVYDSSLSRLKEENYFDKGVIDKIADIGPAAIYEQFKFINEEVVSRNSIGSIDLDNIDLNILEKALNKDN